MVSFITLMIIMRTVVVIGVYLESLRLVLV